MDATQTSPHSNSITSSATMLFHRKHDHRIRRHGDATTGGTMFKISLFLNALLIMYFFYTSSSPKQRIGTTTYNSVDQTIGKEMVWHGGHPKEARAGSCWCGKEDKYCMCTPSVAIDLILRSGDNHVWLVRRKDTDQLAIMGGFVDVNETAEHAVKRELMEEMGVDLKEPPKLFGVYSDPRRDNRRRNISLVYAVYLHQEIHPKAGDDAKEVKKLSLDDVEKHEFFADHKTILLDYRSFIRQQAPRVDTTGDFAADITRSTCAANS
ncbi:MAG: hypothetical protein SGBAC_000321 [Bacillariaceae sp.]